MLPADEAAQSAQEGIEYMEAAAVAPSPYGTLDLGGHELTMRAHGLAFGADVEQ